MRVTPPTADQPPLSPPLRPGDLAAFQDASANAIADELRTALEPGIQLLRPLGAGAMGLVFLGRDPLLKRLVAIKVLSPTVADAEMRARFVREAEASAAVAHPNVAGIFLVGELPASRMPYFVMQFIEGRTLAEEIADGAISESRVKRLVGEIASALAAAHARGLVHRDVKPANIMLESESDRPVVLDFGISAVLQPDISPDAKLTRAGMYLGTPTYMSPEQAAGEPVDGKSDVYSLGAMAFEMLAGRPPFAGSPVVVMAAHLQQPAPDLHAVRPGVDAHLATLVDRCLRKKADERPTAADVAQSLLPDRRALIEWPPPGLEVLRGRGARLAWYWTAVCTAAFLFFVLLYGRPTLSSPQWALGETSSVWSGFISAGDAIAVSTSSVGRQRQGTPVDATPIWTFLVGLGALLLVALALVTSAQALLLARDLFRASRAGYPLQVLLDVAWDRHADSPAMLNRTGRYALLNPEEGQRLRRLRRQYALAASTIVLLTSIVPFAWLFGWLGGGAASDVVQGRELIAFVTPGLFGLITLALIDRRMRAIASAPRAGSGGRRRFRRELVDAWLRAARHDALAPGRRGALGVLGPAGAAGLLVALSYLMVVVFFVVFVSTGALTNGRVAAAEWQRTFVVDSTRPMTFAEFDGLSAKSAVASTSSVPDLAAGQLLLSRPFVAEAPPADASMLALDIDGARAVQRSGAEPVKDQPRSLYTVLGDTAPPPRAAVEAIAAYAETPWLGIWRRVAYSSDFPALWPYRPGLGATSLWSLPIARAAATKDLAYRNSTAGYVALARGDVPAAIARGRENIAVGRQMMRGGDMLDHLIGLVVTGIGGSELGIVGKATKNQALIDEAAALRTARMRIRREQAPATAWLAFVADPRDRKVVRLTKQIDLPGSFTYLLATATSGYCLNSREILFGIDPVRFDLLHGISAAWGAARAPEVEALARSWLTDVANGRATLPNQVRTSVPALAPLRWLGLSRLRNRIEMCASLWLL